MDAGNTFLLKKTIMVRGRTVGELKFRALNKNDVFTLGLPINFGTGNSWSPDYNTMTKYIARLAGLPISSVYQMKPSDVLDASIAIFKHSGRPHGR